MWRRAMEGASGAGVDGKAEVDNPEVIPHELTDRQKTELIANATLDAVGKYFERMQAVRVAMADAVVEYNRKMSELAAKVGVAASMAFPSPAGQHDDPGKSAEQGDEQGVEQDSNPIDRQGRFSTYRELAECILAMTPEQQAMQPQIYASFLHDKRLGVVDLVEVDGKVEPNSSGQESGMATLDIGDPTGESSESVLVKAREPEDARDFSSVKKWQVEDIVGGLPLLCIDTVHNLGVEGFRSCVDNKRNGGDVILLADMNPFGGDGAFAYKMELDQKTGEFLFYDPEYVDGRPTRVEEQLPRARKAPTADKDPDE